MSVVGTTKPVEPSDSPSLDQEYPPPETLNRISNVPFDDGETGRIYYSGDNLDKLYPSTTTITGRLEDTGKDKAIHHWKLNNDGEGDNAYHEHLKWYSGVRGTLIHWLILSQLADVPPSEEEHNALDKIREYDTDYDRVRSILIRRAEKRNETLSHIPSLGEYSLFDESENPYRLKDIFAEDTVWAINQFCEQSVKMGLVDSADLPEDTAEETLSDMRSEGIVDTKSPTTRFIDQYIPETKIRSVESYVPVRHGYSGQIDLLFDKSDGTTVLCDLKTSSGVRYPYQLQSAAYAHALYTDVDELQVCRLYPDGLETELSRSTDWDATYDELVEEFMGLRDKTVEQVQDVELTEYID